MNGENTAQKALSGRFLLRLAETWVFDLDNTLYPASSNLFAQIDERIRGFVADFLDLDPDQAYRVQKKYFRQFGTTLRGLMIRHDMDPKDYLDHVHDIDVTPVAPSPALEAALGRLPGRKIIFTNGTAKHARRITERLGIGHHFDGVFDIVDARYVPKPERRAYEALVRRHRFDPAKTVMVEDIARNLEPAAAMGMTTVWLRADCDWGSDGDSDAAHIHHTTDDLVGWLQAVVAVQGAGS